MSSAAFVDRILTLTAQYRADVAAGARPYRLEINKAFSDQGLPLPIGYALALSQSHFDASGATSGCSSDPDGVGLWRIPRAVAQGLHGGQVAGRRLRTRGARLRWRCVHQDSADAFDNRDDFMYAIACYGRPPAEAGELAWRLDGSAPDAASRLTSGEWSRLESCSRRRPCRLFLRCRNYR
jgi:hypothetical protein